MKLLLRYKSMGADCYTYKLNPEKLRGNLTIALTDIRKSPPFYRHLGALQEEVNNSEHYKGDYYDDFRQSLDLSTILNALADIENLGTSAYLGIILNWIWIVEDLGCLSEDEFVAKLSYYGFELIFYLHEKDVCWVYMNQIDSYAYFNNVEEPKTYDGEYSLLTNKFHRNYLQYLLAVLRKVYLDEKYPYSPKRHYGDGNSFIRNYKGLDKYETAAEMALSEIREENITEDLVEATELHYRRSPTASHYYVAEYLFSDIVELQNKLEDYDGKIFIHYSF
ncbi:hypothetical protein [Mucilaginibacter psychrotolerans]|uniref:Uncharacterized protein n=1 Tax=Mucilaginibacter psychrotolerans TaxID=1524096 RepID=A0A4Y8SLT7_9SPHI|nr:hypothetical protein [Mucilaginibacter psychrotolerans]TFF39537.1 hypothetical protein E2R66_03965 [Mucilaginibacter psychrotolerans]